MYNFCFGQNNRAGVKIRTFSNVLQHITDKTNNKTFQWKIQMDTAFSRTH